MDVRTSIIQNTSARRCFFDVLSISIKTGMRIFIILMPASFVSGCMISSHYEGKVYNVHYESRPDIVIDGKLDEPAWNMAAKETRFIFPWEGRIVPFTEFRALCDDLYFYFAFRVSDDDIIIVQGDFQEKTLDLEDRVELFFARDSELEHYYCLEIDPLGRVHDYSASYYRQFDDTWDWPEVQVGASKSGSGYVVEGLIPHAAFQALNLPSLVLGEELIAGIYRAEFSRGKEGKIEQSWISWVHPQTSKPDFHIPASFGRFQTKRGFEPAE